jgi:hypothetical protein
VLMAGFMLLTIDSVHSPIRVINTNRTDHLGPMALMAEFGSPTVDATHSPICVSNTTCTHHLEVSSEGIGVKTYYGAGRWKSCVHEFVSLSHEYTLLPPVEKSTCKRS